LWYTSSLSVDLRRYYKLDYIKEERIDLLNICKIKYECFTKCYSDRKLIIFVRKFSMVDLAKQFFFEKGGAQSSAVIDAYRHSKN
jgi:hypothetical protein